MADKKRKERRTRCAACGRPTTRGRFGLRRYCSNACRQAAYRIRKMQAARLPGLPARTD